MKFNKIFLAAMAAGLMASCSNEPESTQTPGGSETTGDGYLAVSIKLPSQAGTRAANDNFDDGTANEYEVKNAALLLFTGANGEAESAAQFKSAHRLNLPGRVDGVDNDNITTSYLTAVQVEKSNADNLFGLVLVNYDGIVTTTNGLEIDGASFTGTFGDLISKTSSHAFYSNDASGANTFFMTNAPLSVAEGGTLAAAAPTAGDIRTLVNLKNSLYATEEEAKNNPAGSIYVERAVAKATLSISSNLAKTEIGGEQLEIENVEWRLDNTEPTSYIVRNTGAAEWMGYQNGSNGYRFVGHTKMGTTSIQPQEPLYRTYWCLDPTYAQAEPALDTDVNTLDGFVKAGEKPLYCHENTFSVANQNYPNTTRALLKVTFKGGTFYILNGREDQLFRNVADACSYSVAFILNDDKIKAAVKSGLAPNTSLELDKDNYAQYINIAFARNAETGQYEVTSVTFNDDQFAQAPTWTDADSEQLCSLVNNYYKISEFENGVCYYDLRFMHFASTTASEDLAPWNVTTPNTPTTAEAYPNTDGKAENNWLGRYGMVRNNWYDVNVSAFRHLGKPALPALDVTKVKDPDDKNETEDWIAFKINILSWAKRTQNVEF